MGKPGMVAIIQARMGSTRLQGKALMDIEGKPMLWHVINRLSYSKLIDKMVIATSTDKKDDVIEEFCKNGNIDYYRGSEKDVLDRYYQTAKFYKANVVVRITSDCPLIDSQVSDKVISGYLENMNCFDGASNAINRTYPRGLGTEVISFSSLERAWNEAKKDYEREHVTPYIYEHPELFRLYSVEHNIDLSDLRWTVDEEPDLRFVREIYKRLYKKDRIFFMEGVLKVLKSEPFLTEINRSVKQKVILK